MSLHGNGVVMACRDLVDSGVWNIRRAPVLELDAHVYGTSDVLQYVSWMHMYMEHLTYSST